MDNSLPLFFLLSNSVLNQRLCTKGSMRHLTIPTIPSIRQLLPIIQPRISTIIHTYGLSIYSNPLSSKIWQGSSYYPTDRWTWKAGNQFRSRRVVGTLPRNASPQQFNKIDYFNKIPSNIGGILLKGQLLGCANYIWTGI